MSHWIGLDLAKVRDYTAIATFADSLTSRLGYRYSVEAGASARLTRVYTVDGLMKERGMSYPKVVESLVRLVDNPLVGRDYTLIVDATGVGQAVIDMLYAGGLTPIPITITSGQWAREDQDHGGYTVPKSELVSTLGAVFDSERISLPSPERMPIVKNLLEEFQHFRERPTTAGNIAFGADEHKFNDDLVMALAVAVWYAERTAGVYAIETPPPREPYDPRTWYRSKR